MPILAPISWIGFFFAARAISMSDLTSAMTVSSELEADILDVAAEIGAALLDRLDVFLAEIFLLDAAIHFHGAHGGDDDSGSRLEARLAALDVEEFFGAEIGAEAGLGDDVVGELQRRRGGDDRIAAMRDVGERAAMDEGRVVLQRLHEVRLHGVLEQHRHGAVGLEVAGIDRRSCRGDRRR